MGVPTSEVGYISAMPRREGHEVHKDMWGHWGKNKKKKLVNCQGDCLMKRVGRSVIYLAK